MAHIGQRPAAELIPAAEHGMGVVRMIWPVQRGPEPQLPVKALGDRWRVGWDSRILRPNWPIRPVVNFPERADRAGVNPALDLPDVAAIAGRQKMRRNLRPARGLDDQPRLFQPV